MSDSAPKCVGLTFNNAHFQPPTQTFDCQTFGKVAVGVREGAQGERLSNNQTCSLMIILVVDLAVLCVENIIPHRPTWRDTGSQISRF